MSKPVVCIVGTGGTIASRFDPLLGGHVSEASARDLVEAVPELDKVAEIRVVEHSNINSALMDTRTAFTLRDTLRRVLADEAVAGAVVTHGTATLEESAYLMDLTLGSEKPVVFTGAQRNADEKDPDGPRNLLYAAMIAADPEARGRGVLAALAGQIYAARDVTKVNPEIVTCFGARDGGPVGAVSKYGGVSFFSMPQRRIHLEVDHVKPEVHIIKMVQGGSDLLFRACVEARVDGIVVEGSGGGNVNRPYYDGVCAALEAGIPVIAGLRLVSGAPHAGKGYPGSFQSLVNKGAIAAGFLSGLKARILLMVALAHTQDRDALREIFRKAGG
ncbi:MAG: asparaginase [Burkholderiales bacterium]|nr:asparaginase [Burkholderiales bacterium]